MVPTDYKGEFMLADRRYCYPLTIIDFATQYLIACDALTTIKEIYAFTAFERAFTNLGLPRAIRTDNGVPFASAHELYGLSKLAVWWLRLGFRLSALRLAIPNRTHPTVRRLTHRREEQRPCRTTILLIVA